MMVDGSLSRIVAGDGSRRRQNTSASTPAVGVSSPMGSWVGCRSHEWAAVDGGACYGQMHRNLRCGWASVATGLVMCGRRTVRVSCGTWGVWTVNRFRWSGRSMGPVTGGTSAHRKLVVPPRRAAPLGIGARGPAVAGRIMATRHPTGAPMHQSLPVMLLCSFSRRTGRSVRILRHTFARPGR